VAANFAATDGKFTTIKKEGTASVKIAGAATNEFPGLPGWIPFDIRTRVFYQGLP